MVARNYSQSFPLPRLTKKEMLQVRGGIDPPPPPPPPGDGDDDIGKPPPGGK